MNKNHVFIITCLVITLLISCTPSASVIETAIAETAAAVPTFTRTLVPTATATNTPMPTNTLTPVPEVGNIPGLSRSWVVTELFETKLGLFCNPEVLEDGLYKTECHSVGWDNSSCGMGRSGVVGRGQDTVDVMYIIGVAYAHDELHDACKNLLVEVAAIPYSESTPEIVQSWVLENLKGYGPDSENSMKIEKTFAGVDFHLSVDPDVYSLIIENN